MLKQIHGLLAVVLGVGLSTPGLQAAGPIHGSATSVFLMTNDNQRNEVLAYHRSSDGSLQFWGGFPTGGRGSGGAADPLQSQGSLTLSGDHSLLFAVNAASGTVSSFRLQGSLPLLADQEPSGGAFPVAVAEHEGTVYVLNAGGSGAIEAFHTDGFGRLHEIPNSLTLLTTAASGASSISVSPSGKQLVVIEKVPNSIDVFPINADGTLGKVVTTVSKTPGVFSTYFTPGGVLVVSEDQPNGTDVSSISSYTVNADGTLTAISQSVPTQGDGNCWNVVTPNGQFVYAENAGTGTIAGFSIGSNGSLTPIGGTIVATLADGATNLDIAVSGDGSFIYNLQSGVGVLGIFTVNSDGTLKADGEIDNLPKGGALNGIAAF